MAEANFNQNQISHTILRLGNIVPAHKKPRPLAEGVGEGSQHLHEGVRDQTKPRAKYNEMKKSATADFFLNVPQSGTYRIEDISCETYRAEGISRAAGTQKRCPER